MTSEQLATQAKINARCEAARRAGDIAEMQRCIVEEMSLLRSVYGHRLA